MGLSKPRSEAIVHEGKEYPRVREIFGSLVFDRRAMREHLPKNVFANLEETMAGRKPLEACDADIVAMAMKDWAISNGATHWTHWFHPLTEITAEKHMAFTVPLEDGTPLETFRGKDLMQGEPDASSFPNAGQRSTFEARGYSAWDTSSTAFIVKSPKGGTLCIPSVFLSYDGTPLDLKTGLLRALDSIENQSMKLLRLFGQRGVKYVRMTVGAEQEFFLLDRPRAQKRPDVRFCGRTILGAQPAKDQKLDHHYFGAIPARVLAYMEDVERDLARLGITLSTRHNEVARCQFEFAPLYAEANVACDQNQIIMETMRKLARKHELRLLFHEKPFADMNGSGKHVNFSLIDSEGRNLLKPSSNQRKNIVFLTFLASFVYGAAEHFTFLQAATATAGNMYRLGGHEAPPSIISVYLGEALNRMIRELEHGAAEFKKKPAMDLGLAKLAQINAHDSDRNRTSPLAFTGDKFEFRAPGASQAVALPVTAVAAIWSWGIKRLSEMMERRVEEGKDPLDAALDVVVRAIRESGNILFEGDAYTKDWRKEAECRGLIRSSSTPEAIDLMMEEATVEMLEELGIYKRREIEAIREIRLGSFCTALEVEMSTMCDMLYEGVLPAISKQMLLEKNSLSAMDDIDFPEADEWKNFIKKLGQTKVALLRKADELHEMRARVDAMPIRARADAIVNEAVPLMAEIRKMYDAVEILMAGDIQPYPIYRSLLSLSV
ncbi:glutamine synthetase III [Synergistaceae bacterium OttesenSCG-928-I11]|nr:glutamine synthetase III [Synergistaceae bacterium OttesenSCG-928-I11]